MSWLEPHATDLFINLQALILSLALVAGGAWKLRVDLDTFRGLAVARMMHARFKDIDSRWLLVLWRILGCVELVVAGGLMTGSLRQAFAVGAVVLLAGGMLYLLISRRVTRGSPCGCTKHSGAVRGTTVCRCGLLSVMAIAVMSVPRASWSVPSAWALVVVLVIAAGELAVLSVWSGAWSSWRWLNLSTSAVLRHSANWFGNVVTPHAELEKTRAKLEKAAVWEAYRAVAEARAPVYLGSWREGGWILYEYAAEWQGKAASVVGGVLRGSEPPRYRVVVLREDTWRRPVRGQTRKSPGLGVSVVAAWE